MTKVHETKRCDSAKDRRRFSRFATRLPIVTKRDDLRARSQDDQAGQCRLQLQDFSLGGVRAASAVPLRVDERLTLLVPANGTHPELVLTGRVKHCQRQNDTWLVGIELCQTRPDIATSPWRQLPWLFSVAYTPSAGNRLL